MSIRKEKRKRKKAKEGKFKRKKCGKKLREKSKNIILKEYQSPSLINKKTNLTELHHAEHMASTEESESI
jgi:hypothetical protein